MSECKSKICNPGGGLARGPDGWSDARVPQEVRDAMKSMVMENDTLKKIMELFMDNIERGLKKDTHPTCSLKCYPTYVQDLPDGTEKGKFFALDLGGTNFRVLIIELDGEKCEMKSDIYTVPQELMVGAGGPLFDHIAQCLADFAKAQGVENETIPLGFTFSFPLEQRGLCVGILQRWSKGFQCDDVVGQDVVQWLKDAIDRRGDLKIDICAVLNDTTGTLMSCAWKNHDCRIGLIVGTGNNGCYLEKQENAELFDEPDMGSGKVIINLEMAAFGEDGCLDFIMTEVDKACDNSTINPGKQVFEKLISGMYLGELVRLNLVKLTEAGHLFGGNVSDVMGQKDQFTCKYVSDIESDHPGEYTILRKILKELGVSDATEQDCIIVRYVCEILSRRAGHLVAACMCVLMHKVGDKKITIGVDGSVYKFHPHFRRYMIEKMNQLVNPGITFDVMLSEDGSGRGAALVAAVAAKRKYGGA